MSLTLTLAGLRGVSKLEGELADASGRLFFHTAGHPRARAHLQVGPAQGWAQVARLVRVRVKVRVRVGVRTRGGARVRVRG